MDALILHGCAHVYGDHINTDVIIPGKYTKTLDLQILGEHVLEDLDPDFRERMTPGDILVAGENFGCGSSREQAPLALKSAGVAAVAARSFARIFFRNAVNVGLPVIEVDWSGIETGDLLHIDPAAGKMENLTKAVSHQIIPLPPGMIAILTAGGLANYLRINGDFPE
ncbi:MAG: 3-isopropylmalate dehydratase small subunit [Deltaproteobacteria bacterium]|jgi:3-isopropylmalate dehydratase small subunit|nr:3-isopropylmalate dehydratase small subunit [Deltaproteobacteria bacterium]